MKGPAAIGILAALKPKGPSASPPPKGDEDEAPASEAGESENEYGSELAHMLGIADEDVPDFNKALSGFVRRCMQKDEASPPPEAA